MNYGSCQRLRYSLIVPAMLATMVAYLVTGDISIYERQVPTRLDSPAHRDDFALPLLQNLKVSEVMVAASETGATLATPDTPLVTVDRLLRDRKLLSVPIVENGRLVGMVTARDIAQIAPDLLPTTLARQVMNRPVLRAYPDESLYSAWLRMSRRGMRQIVVVDRTDPVRVAGILTAGGIGRLLRTPETHGVGAAATSAQTMPTTTIGTRPRVSSRPLDDPFAHFKVEAAMAPVADSLVGHTEPLAAARERINEAGVLLVVNARGDLMGIVTRFDVRGRLDVEDGRVVTVGDVAVRNPVTAHAAEPLGAAVRRMSRLNLRQLPVVTAPLPAPPFGILRRSDVLRAYGRALTEEQGASAAGLMSQGRGASGSD